MGQLYWYAYWLMPHPDRSEKIVKCTRGPKEDLPALNEEVRKIWSGHYEVTQLPYRDPGRAKGYIDALFTQKQWDVALPNGNSKQLSGMEIVLRKHSWKAPKKVLT